MSHSRKDLSTLRTVIIWVGVTAGVLLFFALVGTGVEIAYARMYDGRIYPGVQILDVRLDGLTPTEARQLLQKTIDTALADGLRFRFRGQEIQLQATAPGANDSDASHDFIHFDISKALDRATSIGKNRGWFFNVFEQLNARIRPYGVSADFTMDEQGIADALKQNLRGRIEAPRDASFDIRVSESGAPLVHVNPEAPGVTVDTVRALSDLRSQATHLKFVPIDVAEAPAEPRYLAARLEPLTNDVEQMLKRPSITLSYEDQRFRITTSTLASWIEPTGDPSDPEIGLNQDAFASSVRSLAPQLEQPTKNGSLVIKDGKIESFVPGTMGSSIDGVATLAAIQKNWPKQTSFPIVVTLTSGSLLGDDPARLGIKEIIGVGRSNFSGSPANRRKNIQHGADRVNGSIIAPGEEFSLLKTLGVIDGTTGWLPELVIKGDKTTPEFGGGLCQIGTTTFRGALNSGLKITERRNHSYRVRYYEPAGTDATIYDPSPDFRFVNDTGHHVLINAYLKGDDVIFEYWGTKDGRTVDPIKSRVYNIVSPPPMKLIETLDLKPDAKKCTESAHAGADADFTYHVTYADGTEHKEIFSSHYRPWQAVCLVGVEQLSQQGASSTEVVPLAD